MLAKLLAEKLLAQLWGKMLVAMMAERMAARMAEKLLLPSMQYRLEHDLPKHQY